MKIQKVKGGPGAGAGAWWAGDRGYPWVTIGPAFTRWGIRRMVRREMKNQHDNRKSWRVVYEEEV